MTAVWPIDPLQPDSAILERAACILRAGGLVAFPTETVYGLGANALNETAVKNIFEAKGRPSTNPVIVHLAEAKDWPRVASCWPPLAEALAQAFWPGPLTLVLPKSASVPDVVTAGGPTVAVRCPDHPVARGLIRAAGVPLAAPSANRSTELSPTRAEHVLKSLHGRIEAILDAGPCRAGLESTVVDVTDGIRILRPGPITEPMIASVVGVIHGGSGNNRIAKSPGQMARHYRPRTPVLLARNRNEALSLVGLRGTLLELDADPTVAGAKLYATLHELDDGRFERIVVILPPELPEWTAIRDRLARAASD